jgi:hypothetical protein
VTLADLSREIADVEARHASALKRWERMHPSDPEFNMIGCALPKLQDKLADLRRRRTEAQLGVEDRKPERASSPLSDAACSAIAEAIVKSIAPLQKRIEVLEAKPVTTYRGTWSRQESYSPGDQVSHKGGLWTAKVTSSGLRPGDGGLGWQLSVKRGRGG